MRLLEESAAVTPTTSGPSPSDLCIVQVAVGEPFLSLLESTISPVTSAYAAKHGYRFLPYYAADFAELQHSSCSASTAPGVPRPSSVWCGAAASPRAAAAAAPNSAAEHGWSLSL